MLEEQQQIVIEGAIRALGCQGVLPVVGVPIVDDAEVAHLDWGGRVSADGFAWHVDDHRFA